ncbi:MAG: hypothetical protein AAGA48_39695 [Myxococcota bacterium]
MTLAARWTRFVEWIGEPEGATSLALFRIGIGLSVLYTVGIMVLRGLVDVLWVDLAHGGLSPLHEGPWLISWFGGPTPTVVWTFVVLSLLSGVALTIGFGGRFAAFVALLVTTNLVDLNNQAGGSYDELLSNGLWLCLLGGGFRTLSVDAWRTHGKVWPEVPVVAIVRWLAVWQLVLMYGSTGLQKVSAYWVPGGESSALYYILQQPSWHRFDMSFMAWLFPLTQLATLVTWFWEVLSPLWLIALAWDRERDGVHPTTGLRGWVSRLRVRWIFFGVGVAMHLLIHATMDVGPFGVVSLAFYPVMVHPEEWRAFGRWLGWPNLRSGNEDERDALGGDVELGDHALGRGQ